jgi:ribosomal protein S13
LTNMLFYSSYVNPSIKLSENKSIAFALKQIYSINQTSAQAICCKIGVNPNNTLKIKPVSI